MKRKSSAEHLLISRIIADGDATSPLDANLATRYFGSEDAATAWEWILEYRATYSAIPELGVFRRRFPNFPIDVAPAEPMAALIDEVYANYKRRVTTIGLAEAVQHFEQTDDVDETLPMLQEMMSTIAADTSRSDVQLATDIVGKLIVKYLTAEEDEMPGIRTGFALVDEALGGLQDEQLITIVGLPKRMKSSFLLWMAITAMHAGYRVGLVSYEMSNPEQHARWLSLGAEVPLSRMQRGQLTEAEQERLQSYEEEIERGVETGEIGELIFIHDVAGASTVSGLIAKQEQHHFDVLFVDGLYLMEDELGEPQGSSQALTNITRRVKRFAQTSRIPIVCSTQALFARTSKSRGIEMESIAYTSSFAQDSDVLLGIDRLDMNLPISKLKVVAARNALGVECEVSIDYNKGEVRDRGYVTSDFSGGGGGVEVPKYDHD